MGETQSTPEVAAAWEAAIARTKAAGQAIGDAAGIAAKVARYSAAQTGKGLLRGAKAAADASAYIAKTAEDYLVTTIGVGVTMVAKASKTVERCLSDGLADPGGKAGDGELLGESSCDPSKHEVKTNKNIPITGVRPLGCSNSEKDFPKIIYTNGINTSPRDACVTIHKIADTRCAEVIGIYNATDGLIADIVNANLSIEGRRNDPAAMTLSKTVRDLAARKEPISIYAHSEGGLNAIVGLRHAKMEMADKKGAVYSDTTMKKISVTSFGTAQTGWPEGPTYTQYTNFSDPVPYVIGAAQSKSDNPEENLRIAAGATRNIFNTPEWNPIEAHSMDGTYLDKLNSKDPIQKGPGGTCCG